MPTRRFTATDAEHGLSGLLGLLGRVTSVRCRFLGKEASAGGWAELLVLVLCGHFGRTLAGACLSAEPQVLHSKPD